MDPEGGSDTRRRPGDEPAPGLLDVRRAGMYLVDEQGAIVRVNRAAEVLLRRPATALLGHDAHDLLHRDGHGHTMPRIQCPLLQAFLAGRPAQGGQAWYERGDGTLLPMFWTITPCIIEPGAPGAMVVFHEPAFEHTEGDPSSALTDLARLALLAETTAQLTSTLSVDEMLKRLTRLLVPRLADWAVVDLITEGDEVRRAIVVHHEDGALVNRADLAGPLPPVPRESPLPLSRALWGAAPALAGPETYHGPPDSCVAVAQRRLFQVSGMHSAATAPIRSPRDVLGALTLGRSERLEAFTDLPLLEEISRRAGVALDNARLYQRQRHVAETMQRHLLPRLPTVPGLEMTARYVSAPEASQVGGDWYDVFRLPDGAVAVAIGDVVGHDIDAAAAMAQIRSILRAYAWSYEEPPSLIVDRLDRAVEHLSDAALATVFFSRVETVDGWARLRWTNAGHPPPLLVTHDGHCRFLDEPADPVIGTGMVTTRTDTGTDFPATATLVLYTDGLVESPSHSIDTGLDALRRHAAALAQHPLDTFCDLLLSRVRPEDNEDDVAVLALRRPGDAPG